MPCTPPANAEPRGWAEELLLHVVQMPTTTKINALARCKLAVLESKQAMPWHTPAAEAVPISEATAGAALPKCAPARWLCRRQWGAVHAPVVAGVCPRGAGVDLISGVQKGATLTTTTSAHSLQSGRLQLTTISRVQGHDASLPSSDTMLVCPQISDLHLSPSLSLSLSPKPPRRSLSLSPKPPPRRSPLKPPPPDRRSASDVGVNLREAPLSGEHLALETLHGLAVSAESICEHNTGTCIANIHTPACSPVACCICA